MQLLEGLSLTASDAQLQEAVQFCVAAVPRSPTPYTGSAGLAYALWRAGHLFGRSEWQQQARDLAAAALRRAAHLEDASLLDGRAGVLLVNCLMSAEPSDPPAPSSITPLLSQYAAICTSASHPGSGASDEVLYGRAGTLLGGLLLRQHLGAGAVPDAALTQLAGAMLTSGRDLAARLPVFSASGARLAYMWPPGHSAEPYLGAAHGLIGILYALLLLQQAAPQCMPDAAADLTDIRAALGYVLSCEQDAPGCPQGSGGHYPTLMRLQGFDSSSSRTLVHWCHGAPGAVFMWCAAHEVLGDDASYLPAALRAGELVWTHGLLKKGPGLCHGVSGNAYALLRLYKTTQDTLWLDRARAYAAFMVSTAGKADWHTPDHPGSLFEGMSGGVCLLAELQAAAAAAAAASEGKQDAAADARALHQAVCRLVTFPLFELSS